jgi:predicted RNase H-like HicB family nuclease
MTNRWDMPNRIADKRHNGNMALHYQIETEIEDDGRWIAEAVGLPGVLAYGCTQDEAISHVEAIALRVIADRVENQELPARGMTVSFGA